MRHGKVPAGFQASSLDRYLHELGRYPMLSVEEELRAASVIDAAELEFWLVLLGYAPAFRLIAALNRAARGKSQPELQGTRLQRLWQACETTGSKHGESASPNDARELARAVRGWDTSRACMRLAVAWVNALRPHLASETSRSELIDYQRAVRRVHHSQAGAKQRFAAANLRLVVAIAAQHNQGGLPLADLIQEGNMGLMTAIERFDPSRGARFSTYASFWIRHLIRRALTDKSRAVRAPSRRQQQASELARCTARWLAQSGRQPTTDELAKELRWSERTVRNLERRPSISVWSLERPVAADRGDETFLDFLADASAIPIDEVMARRDQDRELTTLLGELRPVEARVLHSRYGLNGADEATLQAVGDALNLSRERVRQIQIGALNYLRRRIEGEPRDSFRQRRPATTETGNRSPRVSDTR